MTLEMVHRLKKTSTTVSSLQNCLKCDIRIFTLWNWDTNGCHFTM